jgi:hypothetical protein
MKKSRMVDEWEEMLLDDFARIRKSARREKGGAGTRFMIVKFVTDTHMNGRYESVSTQQFTTGGIGHSHSSTNFARRKEKK